MIKNKLFIYLLVLAFGLFVPYLFPAYKLQISILWILNRLIFNMGRSRWTDGI